MVVLAEAELRVAPPMETELRVAAPTVARVVARVAAALVVAMVVVMVAATRAVTMVVVTVMVTRAVAMVAVMVAAMRAVTMVVVMVAATRAVALVTAGGRGGEAERVASSVAPKAEELPVVPVGRVMTRWSASAPAAGSSAASPASLEVVFEVVFISRYSLGSNDRNTTRAAATLRQPR